MDSVLTPVCCLDPIGTRSRGSYTTRLSNFSGAWVRQEQILPESLPCGPETQPKSGILYKGGVWLSRAVRQVTVALLSNCSARYLSSLASDQPFHSMIIESRERRWWQKAASLTRSVTAHFPPQLLCYATSEGGFDHISRILADLRTASSDIGLRMLSRFMRPCHWSTQRRC